MAFTPFVESDQPTMAAFNEKFQELLAECYANSASIETGSYIGSGTYGEANPCSLTFQRPPKLLIITKPLSVLIVSNYAGFNIILTVGGTNATFYGLVCTISGNTISWYSKVDAGYQDNNINYEYSYLAFLQ